MKYEVVILIRPTEVNNEDIQGSRLRLKILSHDVCGAGHKVFPGSSVEQAQISFCIPGVYICNQQIVTQASKLWQARSFSHYKILH